MRSLAIALFLTSLPAAAAAAGPRQPPTPPAPPPPAPNVVLSIVAPTPRGPWRMRVTNAGEVPVRIVADARLLTLEVFAPNARAPVRCALPADMRANNDVDRALIVPPRRSYGEDFDPRLYCFGAHERGALVPGATVVAHLGWTPPAAPARAPRMPARTPPPRPSPPFEVSPLEGVYPETSPLKELVAAQLAVPADPNAPLSSGGTGAPRWDGSSDPFPPKLSVRSTPHVDAASTFELSMAVTVKNEGQRSVTMLLRPETIGFEVVGAQGTERCAWPTAPSASIRELFTTLAPGHRAATSVLLDSVCTGNSFDQPGIFLVRPILDTRRASGQALGLRTFDGEVVGEDTTVLRLHRGRRPQPLERPRLEP